MSTDSFKFPFGKPGDGNPTDPAVSQQEVTAVAKSRGARLATDNETPFTSVTLKKLSEDNQPTADSPDLFSPQMKAQKAEIQRNVMQGLAEEIRNNLPEDESQREGALGVLSRLSPRLGHWVDTLGK